MNTIKKQAAHPLMHRIGRQEKLARIKCAGGVVCVVLCMMIGVFFPKLWFYLHDEKIEDTVITIPTETIHFQTEQSMFHTLDLMYNVPYQLIPLPLDYVRENIAITQQLVLSFLDELYEEQLLPYPVADWKFDACSPELCIAIKGADSEDRSVSLYNNQSSIVWLCSLSTRSHDAITLTLDDVSGKIIQFTFSDRKQATANVEWQNTESELRRGSSFLTEYFDCEQTSFDLDLARQYAYVEMVDRMETLLAFWLRIDRYGVDYHASPVD